VLLLCCATELVSAQSSLVDENLLFAPPKGFQIGYQSRHGNNSITELIPSGQTVDDWTQMLTVEIFRGATVDAPDFLGRVGGRYRGDCPNTTAQGIVTGHVNGYEVSMLLLRCPLNPHTGKPETTAFRAIKGADALYLVQHAWRAVPSDQTLDEAMHALAKVTVCDTRTPEHPCPALNSLTPSK